MFTYLAANKHNFVKIKTDFTRHKILVKKVVNEKILVETCKYKIHLK